MVRALTHKPKQRNPKHPGGHQLKKDHENIDTGRPAKCKPGLAKIKTSGSIYIQIPKVLKPIAISDDPKYNQAMAQELKQHTMNKMLVVETGKDDDDKDQNYQNQDDEDWEDDDILSITWEEVDKYLVSTIQHLKEYT